MTGRCASAVLAVALWLSVPADARALEVGVAAGDITPVVGVPLAGFGGGDRRRAIPDLLGLDPYSFYLTPSTGVRDPIRAKAMVLREGGRELAFVSLDLVAVPRDLRESIVDALAPLGLEDAEVIVSATHTHSGPGTLSAIGLWEISAADRFESEIHDLVVGRVAAVVGRAVGALEPAELAASSFTADGIQENRRDVPGHFDSTANLLLARSAGGGPWLGAVANLAVHGTVFGDSSRVYSADLPGAIERELGAALGALNPGGDPVPVLFVNGAEGDVKPANDDLEGMAEQLAADAVASLPDARAVAPDWTVERRAVDIASPFVHLKGCSDGWLQNLLWRRWGLYLGGWLPERAHIASIALGDLRLMTWPGEPTTSLGLALRETALDRGAAGAWVLGLTDDHLAYFTTPEEFEEGGYEACVSLYGPHAGRKIVKAHRQLLPPPP